MAFWGFFKVDKPGKASGQSVANEDDARLQKRMDKLVNRGRDQAPPPSRPAPGEHPRVDVFGRREASEGGELPD